MEIKEKYLHDIKNKFFILEQELVLAGRWLAKMQTTLKEIEQMFWEALEEVENASKK